MQAEIMKRRGIRSPTSSDMWCSENNLCAVTM
jgi:hypothetical protein